MESYIPGDCLTIFPELEDFLCYGCSQNEAKYRDDDEKTIKICRTLAKKIWKSKSDDDLNKPSTRFDGCGLLAEDNHFSEIAEEDLNYIIPSKEFDNFTDFINTLKLPYYEDYEIEIIDGNENDCFNNNYFIKSYPIINIMIIIFSFFNLL